VISQVKASIAWGKVIRRKIRPSIDISDDEVNEAYARIEANKDKPQNLLAEIFLAVDSPDKEPEVKAIADRLVREIREGASFVALARQFSESASALNGGDIGWVTEGQLGPELDAALKTLRPPTLTEPIRTPGGFYIIALRDRQVPSMADKGGTTISLREEQVAIPAGISKQDLAARMTEAKTFHDRAKSCDELDSMGQQAGWTSSGDLGWVHAEELPDDLHKVVDTLPVKKVSEPLRRSEGLTVIMICDRKEQKSVIPSRDDVADALLRQRIELQADRYLRDLRSNASVDNRI
ncbi:MAG: peptidylprolyl isomerase, partial [Alphaproteobacteria bacterium]